MEGPPENRSSRTEIPARNTEGDPSRPIEAHMDPIMDWFRTSSELVRDWFRGTPPDNDVASSSIISISQEDGIDEQKQKQRTDATSMGGMPSDPGNPSTTDHGHHRDTILENDIIMDDYTDDIRSILQ